MDIAKCYLALGTAERVFAVVATSYSVLGLIWWAFHLKRLGRSYEAMSTELEKRYSQTRVLIKVPIYIVYGLITFSIVWTFWLGIALWAKEENVRYPPSSFS